MTGVMAALVEAWGEVRIHRVRVIMSLVGVLLAVFAITVITGQGDMARQANQESYERGSGRVATLSVDVWSETESIDADAKLSAFTEVIDRYQIEYASLVSDGSEIVMLGQSDPVNATVVGVITNEWPSQEPLVYLLTTAADRWNLGKVEWTPQTMLELWVPHEQADAVEEAVARDLMARIGGEARTEIWWSDPSDFEIINNQLTWVIRGISVFALALGALGLVNIAMVTVRYRIREIGIRRSFGATSGRVFFSIMMESVFATMAAGLVGVGVAVVVMKNLPPDLLNVTDLPPFPVRAAVEGMVVATLVGAIAGLLPATVAVRAKVIDAIRY